MEMPPLHEQQKRKRSDFQLKQKSPKQNLHNDSNPVDFTRRSSSPQPNTTHSGTSHPAIDHVDIMSTSPIGSSSSRDNLTDYDAMLLSNRNTSSVSSIQSQDDAPRRRKKRSSSVSDLCPVCGLTVRESDLAAHLQMEIEKLSKLPSDLRRKAFCHRRSSIERKFSFGATSSSNATSTSSKRLADRDLSPKSERDNREKTFRKVRSNRLERLNSRVGSCLRAQRGTDGNSPSHRVWIGHSGALMCPVCSRAIQGGSAEISAHVGECLRQRRQSPQLHEDEDVDVENDMTHGITNQEDTRSNQSFGSDEWRT
uniref:E3 ubiquitin-protein ligase RNF220 middle domain-containing protein n=1 Tax=Ciona savignyi TaxID=51511 RepID=H2YZ26_CIOSA